MPAHPATALPPPEPPLAGLRVLDLCDGKGESCGRYLADLGAEVLLVEPPGGMRSRGLGPVIAGHGLYFEARNTNKRSTVIDLHDAAGRARFLALLDEADILIESGPPGGLDALGLGEATLRATRPGLVVLSITDFGQDGPYRDFRASGAVHAALGGVLARSGIAGERPLLPPGQLAQEAAAVQAAWVALLALWQREHDGAGDRLDFSILEATLQAIDPALGVTGSANAGRGARETTPRGRPPRFPLYPIFRCADGLVRICVLNPRQWQAMSDWLGDSHPFTDPRYGDLVTRIGAVREINALIGALFAPCRAADLVDEGQRRGVPIALVASPADVLADAHFAACQAFVQLDLGDGHRGALANGYCSIDGERAGIRTRAPRPGEHDAAPFAAARQPRAGIAAGAVALTRRPLEGIRVLDLGVIVAGAEIGRLFADQGAEVIKIENAAFPDGLRQNPAGRGMSVSFAQGSRNKLSCGINLRSAAGKALFLQLVERADLVLSNFKPGTLESLGLGYAELSRINPGIVMTDSSALGARGPRSRTMGYGPLVRAMTGLTGLWRYPELEEGFCDGTTIFPDHFAARVAAVATLALLLRRRRTGRGGTASVSQAECILNALAPEWLRESLAPGALVARGNADEFHAPAGVFPCAGDDEWCALAVEDDAGWRQLCTLMQRGDWLEDPAYVDGAGRLRHRAAIEDGVAAWTRAHAPQDVMQRLQAAGIACGLMRRVADYEFDPQLQARGFFRRLEQPGIGMLLTENGPVGRSRLPEPPLRPAPAQGEHTRTVMQRLLGLDDAAIDALIAAGDLEVPDAG